MKKKKKKWDPWKESLSLPPPANFYYRTNQQTRRQLFPLSVCNRSVSHALPFLCTGLFWGEENSVMFNF